MSSEVEIDLSLDETEELTPRELYIVTLKEALGDMEGTITSTVDELVELCADAFEVGFEAGAVALYEKIKLLSEEIEVETGG